MNVGASLPLGISSKHLLHQEDAFDRPEAADPVTVVPQHSHGTVTIDTPQHREETQGAASSARDTACPPCV